MELLQMKGALIPVILKEMLPALAKENADFRKLFEAKSMNECSNRLYDAMYKMAAGKSCCIDVGTEPLLHCAVMYYEEDATSQQMKDYLDKYVESREQIQLANEKKATKKNEPKPPTKPKVKMEVVQKPAAPAPAEPVASAPSPATIEDEDCPDF